MQRVPFLLGTLAAGVLAAGCVGGPARSPNPLGHQSPDKDYATQELYPLRSSPVKEEVDRQFEEEYPGVVNWIYVWGKDRWLDLMDIASWDVQFGRGFGANVSFTEWAEAGVGGWKGLAMGQNHRGWGVWEEDIFHYGLGPFYWIEYERRPVWGTKTLHEMDYKYTGFDLWEEPGNKGANHDQFDLAASLHLFAVGADAALSPIEAVDFLAGLNPVTLIANLVGYRMPNFDIMADDTYSKMEQRLREEKGLGE